MTEKRMKRRMLTGYIVFGGLAGIKIIEYVLAQKIRVGDWPYLGVLALVSAWLIVYYYKHIHQLWDSGSEGNE